jgi:hypothetical protein
MHTWRCQRIDQLTCCAGVQGRGRDSRHGCAPLIGFCCAAMEQAAWNMLATQEDTGTLKVT